jgi:hypothetical protein
MFDTDIDNYKFVLRMQQIIWCKKYYELNEMKNKLDFVKTLTKIIEMKIDDIIT